MNAPAATRSHGVRFFVTLAVLVVAAGCGNNTTREERLAARGILPSAAPLAEPTNQADSRNEPPDGGTAPSASPSGPRTASSPTAGSVRSSASGRTPAPQGTGPSIGAPPVGTAGGRERPSPMLTPATGASAKQPTSPQPNLAEGAADAGKREIVLGSFGAEAGLLGRNQQPAIAAIRAWTARVNSNGGLNGHRVRLLMADDGGDSARAQGIVRQMVEGDHVAAFVYPFTVGTLVPTLPYLEQRGIPVLGHIGAETLADYSSAVFQPLTGADEGTAWGFILGITTQTDKKKLGILYCHEVAACSLIRDGIKRRLPYNGLQHVYDAQISIAQPDFTAEVLSAQRAGVDVLVVFADAATVNRVAVSAHRQNYRPVLSAPHNVQNEELTAYNDLDGLTFYSRVAPYPSDPMAEYRAVINQYQPKKPLGELGAAAYVVGKLLERIAPLIGDAPTPAAITEALYSLQNETLDGLLPPITFPREKDRSKVNLCIVPVTFKGRQFVTSGARPTFVCAPGWKKSD